MPKIIEKLDETILDKALLLVEEEGLDHLNVRTLSQQCGIAPGTVYNYYASKEILIGSVISKRWNICLEAIDAELANGSEVLDALAFIVKQLRIFMKPIAPFWAAHMSHDEAAQAAVLSEEDHVRREHVMSKRTVIGHELMARVTRIAAQAGMDEAVIDELAPTLTRLLIICSHDSSLDIHDVVKACAALPGQEG